MNNAQIILVIAATVIFGGAGYATGLMSSAWMRWLRLAAVAAAVLITALMIIPVLNGSFPIFLPMTVPYLIGVAAGILKLRLSGDDCGCDKP